MVIFHFKVSGLFILDPNLLKIIRLYDVTRRIIIKSISKRISEAENFKANEFNL